MYNTYDSVSITTPWAGAGPHGQLVNYTLTNYTRYIRLRLTKDTANLQSEVILVTRNTLDFVTWIHAYGDPSIK